MEWDIEPFRGLMQSAKLYKVREITMTDAT